MLISARTTRPHSLPCCHLVGTFCSKERINANLSFIQRLEKKKKPKLSLGFECFTIESKKLGKKSKRKSQVQRFG